jgi:hypothetical protein
MLKLTLALCCSLFLAGCTISSPATLGEKDRQEVSYGYTPIDPLPINFEKQDDIFSLLPDTTMRLAVGSFDSSGNITYGPVKVGMAGSRYQVILDYIQYAMLQIPVSVKELPLPDEARKAGKKHEYDVEVMPSGQAPDQYTRNIPVYVGIGLRLTADVTVVKDNVDLSNIVALGVAASSNEIHGTLTVQAMGISGELVSETLPLPSTLDQSTIQQAMMALGNIKAKAYGKDKILITPQVVAVYNPFNNSGPQTVTGLIEIVLQDQSSLKLQKDMSQVQGKLVALPTTRP